MRRLLSLLCVCLSFCSSTLYADTALIQQSEVKAFIHEMVQQHGFNRVALEATLRQAAFQPQIIASMERPYEKKTWDVYKALFLTPARVQAGLDFWQQNRAILAQAEQKFGVPAPIIVAIIGVETLY